MVLYGVFNKFIMKSGFCLPQYFRFDFSFIGTDSSSDYNIQLNLMFAILKCMIVKYRNSHYSIIA
ncbi:hypothetical protein Anas_00730 [Armadillidium nasatum]|uniref:Uncharacterized protein n=1 Tax=Armadillidium nasatum TaxID=96803 RepID=A0A5N5TIN9_9CRUS|nr:hypothetical protein Anas_00730 [Armadillidium nasatum]